MRRALNKKALRYTPKAFIIIYVAPTRIELVSKV